MPLDFRNINTIWSSLIVETLAQLGLETAVICPGSRSTPLTIAFAQHPTIKTIPILDERSASFFALGIAKQTHKPTVLVCTSGTAGANFYPAVIEAKYSYVPLIILTADRPPELRQCHGGQTINQVNLYGNYPRWQTELSLPSLDLERLYYVRQNMIYGWERATFPMAGVVHYNIPFREPLAPIKQLNFSTQEEDNISKSLLDHLQFKPNKKFFYTTFNFEYLQEWKKYEKGLIIGGLDNPHDPRLYCRAIAHLAEALEYPVLAEALSPLRNHENINNNLICNYDLMLRNEELQEILIPELVILIGEYPTSKELRKWLNKHKITTYIITPHDDNLDALHGNTIHLRINIVDLISNIKLTLSSKKTKTNYLANWLNIDRQLTEKVDRAIEEHQGFFEGKISWLLSKLLPPRTSVFIANSMSVRYAEYFWQKNNRESKIYFSRGTNGIDGTLSTAMGIAHENQKTVLLTGDLALLHDTNGFLNNKKLIGSLTIILVNNYGGGIFEMLPIAEFENIFEDYFATPQEVNFANLCQTYHVQYKLITSWSQLESLIKVLPEKGIRVLEIQTNRKYDSRWLKTYFPQLSQLISI